jgi:hypothetical protein
LLGEGAYGATDSQRETVLPVFRFGTKDDLARWLRSHGALEFSDAVKEHHEAIVEALDSVAYVDFDERAAYDMAMVAAKDPAAFKAEWEDENRTSLTQICLRAWSVAEHMRES